MIPATYPTDSQGRMKVKEVTDTTGLQEWVDYIPVQEVTDVAGKDLTYDNDGHIPVVKV